MAVATPRSGICPTEISTFAEEALSDVTGKSKIQCKLRVKRHPESVSLPSRHAFLALYAFFRADQLLTISAQDI